MKRLLLVLIAIPVLWLAGRALVHALASDETQILWHVEAVREGYNSGDIGDVMVRIHRDWRHERPGVDREMLKGGLLQEFFQDRHPSTKELLRRVDVDQDSIEVRVEGDEAQLGLEAWFSRRGREDEWNEVWRARIEADLVRTEDGWRIQRSRHEDLSGSRLSR